MLFQSKKAGEMPFFKGFLAKTPFKTLRRYG
jgi:hypothetical protein